MTIVMVLTSIERRSPRSGSTPTLARCRARGSPRRTAGVRRCCERFGGQELEVGLEATTGWRFVAEELRRVGAAVHLAEPAETAARRGNKQRAKSDRADARHLRELLLIDRLPESWIASITSSICGLGCGCATRFRTSAGSGQQRIQAVLYHHGCRSGAT